MFAIRYAALLSLVVWLGGMITLALFGISSPDVLANFHLAEYICGTLLLVCLFAIKFIGPPPHGFIPRVAIVVLMLIVAVSAGLQLDKLPKVSNALRTANLGLGLALLYWYVKE